MFRMYLAEKLPVRRKGGRKRAIGTRAPMLVPIAPNQQGSLDFVSDQLTDGQRFRTLTVVDNCTRGCLALVADTSLSSTRVARELATIISDQRGSESDPGDRFPKERHRVPLERDPGFLRQTQGCLARHRTGQPDPERIYRVVQRQARDALLNEPLFPPLADWRTDHNPDRPHSSIGWQTPNEHTTTFAPQRGPTLNPMTRAAPAPGRTITPSGQN